MSKLWQLLPVLLVFYGVYGTNAQHCTIEVPKDLPPKTPVILTPDGLFRPVNTVTRIEQHKSITLLCVGPNNNNVLLNQPTVTLTCENGAFWYGQTAYQLSQMGCKAVPSSELRETGNACANNAGIFYNVGFTFNNIFYDLFTICFNKVEQRAIYSRNLINGKMQSARTKRTSDPTFRVKGMDFNANNYYAPEGQKERFETLFGVNQMYVNLQNSFLARGHLTPNADFIFYYEQYATYYYANCAPEWQVVNSGNWVRVENAVRKLASNYGSDLLVYTGTLGVLELPHPTNSRLIEVYLGENNRVVAPKWYYKVVMHPNLPIDIVFVTLNNPFFNADHNVEFCTNVCQRYNLDSKFYKDAKRGYTFCCELKDFWATAMSGTSVTPYYELPPGWRYK